MADGGEVVDVTDATNEDIGSDKCLVLSEKHTIRAIFRDFANLPHERGKSIKSASLLCHGHRWSVMVYPRGDSESSRDIVHVSLFLTCLSWDCSMSKAKPGLKAVCRLRVPSAGISVGPKTQIFSKSSTSLGKQDFATRAEVLDDILVDGDLTVEADIQIYTNGPSIWKPKTTLHRDLLKVLASGKRSGDVKFLVGDEECPAHRNILEARAPALAALAEGYPSDTPIPIQNVDASTFRSLLHFVYADELPNSEELQQEAQKLLDVADRFGCTGLKLAAEAELATSGITVDTAADMVLLGDAKNCALLKEAAVDFVAANPSPVMASSGWAKMKESASLLSELMEAAFTKKRSAPGASEERDYKRMCVSDLRRKLDEKGLDVDGSKEVLVNRLEKEEEDGGIDESAEDGGTDDSSHEDN